MPASDEIDEFPRAAIRSWLMDTGCKHDLTTRDAAPLCQVGVITKARNPVLLSTANDILSSGMVVPQQIGALGCDAETVCPRRIQLPVAALLVGVYTKVPPLGRSLN